MTSTKKPTPASIPKLFEDNELYQRLDARTQQAVDIGIQEELAKINNNRILSDDEKMVYTKWYLEERAPIFIENMLMGQEAADDMMRKIRAERAAKERSVKGR
jgi:hypothetical protein